MTDDLGTYERLKEKPSLFVEEIIGEEPFDYQKEFMDNDNDRKVFVTGRQVGKSRTASWMALHYAVTHPGSLVLVTADALRQSSELFAQLQSEMNEAGITNNQWGVDRSTQTTIEFDHGSRIKVVPTGRTGDKIRGYSADYIVVDEAAFVDDPIFEEVIEPMTFVTDGTIVLCSTPYGTSGYFWEKATSDRWHSTWDEETGGISSYDNPLIEEEDIEEYKQGKTDAQVQREVHGRFVEAGDVFFPPALIRKSMSSSVTKTSNDLYLGVDPSGEGDAESAYSIADSDGNVFLTKTHNGTLPQLRRKIQDMHSSYGFSKILVDYGGVGTGFVQELKERIDRRTVEDTYLTIQTKQDMYQTLKAGMQSKRIRITHDEDTKAQMENLGFSRTQNGNVRIQPKEDELNDDRPDSIALAVWALPDTAGNEMKSAGMTKMKKLGELKEDRNGRKKYQFDSSEDDDENINRVSVGSTRLHYHDK